MNSFIFTYHLGDIDTIAEKVLSLLDKGTVLLKGDMGSGKTTFVAALLKAMGSTDNVSSPTFSIINEYHTEDDKVFHFDLYRIESLDEALSFGIDEYVNSGNWLFIEWPDRISDILPDKVQDISIEHTENNKRSLKLTIEKQSLTEINAMDTF